MKQYYPFIDIAKGIGIFCVLMVHAAIFVFSSPNTIIQDIISTFYLTLFFWASGFVSSKFWMLNVSLRDIVGIRTLVLLFPFFITGTLYIAISSPHDFSDRILYLWRNSLDYGFWFVFLLTVFRVAVIAGRWLSQWFQVRILHSQRANIACNIIFMVLCCFALSILFNVTIGFQRYFVFYIISVFVCLFNLHMTWLKNDILLCICFVLSIVLFAMDCLHAGTYPILTLKLFATATVFMLILRCNPNYWLAKFFKSIGTFSLDIYVLHWFLLVGFDGLLPDDSILNLPLLLQVLILIVVALCLLGGTLILTKIIRKSALLSLLLIGRTSQTFKEKI